METISEMLGNAISNGFSEASGQDIGPDSYDEAIKAINILYKLRIDESKVEYENTNKAFSLDLEKQKLESELELKKAELKLREKELEFKERQMINERYQFDAEIAQKNNDRLLREKEINVRKAQVDNEATRLGVEVIKTIAGITAFGLGIRSILKFEETGTITSKAFGMIPKVKFW